jgi:transcriptional regulator with XRE-family HTH domain
MTDLHQNLPNTDVQRLKDLLQTLSMTQLRFMVMRMDAKSDKEAAEAIGLAPGTVKNWENKAQVDEAVNLMRFDGMLTALEIRRRALPLAMKVKLEGLEYTDKRLKQSVATEFIEGSLGKPTQPHQLEGNLNLKIDGLNEALSKVYGGDSNNNGSSGDNSA